jgi:hypothetical protein
MFARRDYRLVAEDGVASPSELQALIDAAIAERTEHELPTSIIQALDWLIRHRCADELNKFLIGRTPRELDLIREHIFRRRA